MYVIRHASSQIKLLFLISGLVIVLFPSASFSLAFTVDDIFTKLISVDASGGYGVLTFEMRNPHATESMSISTNSFRGYSIDITGNPTRSIDIFYLSFTNRTHYKINEASCTNITETTGNVTNRTYQICDKMADYTFLEWRFLPLDKTILLPPGENITIKFEVRWQPAVGFQSRDIQPAINFQGVEYRQNKWAFLNVNYSFYKWVRIFENASLDRYNQPIWVNLSADPDFSACCSDTNYTDVFVSSNWTGTEVEIASDVVNGSIRGWSPNDWFLVFLVNLSGPSGNRSMNETYKIYANYSADTTYKKYSAGITVSDGTGYEADCAYLINTTINAFHLCNGASSADRAGIRGVSNNSFPFRFADSNYIAWGNRQGTFVYRSDMFYNGSVVKSFNASAASFKEFYTFYSDSSFFEITMLDPMLLAQGSSDGSWVVHTKYDRDASHYVAMDNTAILANANPSDNCATIKRTLAISSHSITNNHTLSLWREWRTREQTANTTYHCQLDSGSDSVTPMNTDDGAVGLSNGTMHMSFKTLTNKGSDNQTNMKELTYQLNYTIGPKVTNSSCTGTLSAVLITPANNFEVQRNGTFTLSVNASCTGGCCGLVTATADPKISDVITSAETANIPLINSLIFISFAAASFILLRKIKGMR